MENLELHISDDCTNIHVVVGKVNSEPTDEGLRSCLLIGSCSTGGIVGGQNRYQDANQLVGDPEKN